MKDTQYVALSARIRAMEPHLITLERLERLMEASDNQGVEKLLQEWGIPAFDVTNPTAMDQTIAQMRGDTVEALSFGLPQMGLLDVFSVEYDYHNVKSLLKARAMGQDATRMLSSLGRIAVATLVAAVETGEYGDLPSGFAQAVAEATQVLDTTRDPQQGDMVLDRYYFAELAELASTMGNQDLVRYVQLKIDAVNLRTLVRTVRMGKPPVFLAQALFAGGSVDSDVLVTIAQNGGAGLEELYQASGLETAANLGVAALKGGVMTGFEQACDNAVSAYWDFTKLIPFGESVVLAYLAAKETEYLNLRIVLLGRGAGLPADVIASRLRTSCL
ncbi:V-type ATPase subunit [Bengtsoniella intestinalis]|uniref:V-type ATPase subunit n=1 Tax=Bengtsoniella intestinalis TaxID=3073143 RepID=UPI00391FC6F8